MITTVSARSGLDLKISETTNCTGFTISITSNDQKQELHVCPHTEFDATPEYSNSEQVGFLEVEENNRNDFSSRSNSHDIKKCQIPLTSPRSIISIQKLPSDTKKTIIVSHPIGTFLANNSQWDGIVLGGDTRPNIGMTVVKDNQSTLQTSRFVCYRSQDKIGAAGSSLSPSQDKIELKDIKLINCTGCVLRIQCLDKGTFYTYLPTSYRAEPIYCEAEELGKLTIQDDTADVPIMSPKTIQEIVGIPKDSKQHLIVSEIVARHLAESGSWKGHLVSPNLTNGTFSQTTYSIQALTFWA